MTRTCSPWPAPHRSASTSTLTVIEDVTSPYTLTNLKPGTNYLISVRAVSSNGLSEWSDPVAVRTLGGGQGASRVHLGITVRL